MQTKCGNADQPKHITELRKSSSGYLPSQADYTRSITPPPGNLATGQLGNFEGIPDENRLSTVATVAKLPGCQVAGVVNMKVKHYIFVHIFCKCPFEGMLYCRQRALVHPRLLPPSVGFM